MSQYKEDSFMLVVTLVNEYRDLLPSKIIKGVIKLLPLVDHYQKLAIKNCNEPLNDNERRWLDEILESKIENVNTVFFDGKLEFDYNGDPRGYCIKLKLPSGYSNSFASDLYAIPTYSH